MAFNSLPLGYNFGNIDPLEMCKGKGVFISCHFLEVGQSITTSVSTGMLTTLAADTQ